ncbi:MAG: hypothetical protein ACRD2A_09885, partial [Vicinamibacterales bacterium]
MAAAVELVRRGGLEAVTGLSPEMALVFDGLLTVSEARMLTSAAATLSHMPQLESLFKRGIVSWGQVRAIVCAVGCVRVAGRAKIDALIAERAPSLVQS